MMECVVVAAYNEEKYLGDVLQETKKICKDIIVVDDGSSDKTADIAEKAGVVVVRHTKNKGKGVAVKTGCAHALKKGFDEIILMDADGQHDPKDIPRFLEALKDKDIVFGYRRYTKEMPVVFRFGNWCINMACWMLFGLKLHDTQCGYRAFRSDVYEKIKWKACRYSMESEMIANAGKARLRYTEIPIKTVYNDHRKGTTVLDGIKIVLDMIRMRLR